MENGEKHAQRSREMLDHAVIQERVRTVELQQQQADEEAKEVTRQFEKRKAEYDALTQEWGHIEPSDKELFNDLTKRRDEAKKEIEALEQSKSITDANLYELSRELGELREVQRQLLGRGQSPSPEERRQ